MKLCMLRTIRELDMVRDEKCECREAYGRIDRKRKIIVCKFKMGRKRIKRDSTVSNYEEDRVS